VVAAATLFAALMAYSLFQERLMTHAYPPAADAAAAGTAVTSPFTHSLFLVCANRLAAVVCAAATAAVAAPSGLASLRPSAPLTAYAAVAATNVVATSAQYEALRHLTFPAVALGKCNKVLSVMLLTSAGAACAARRRGGGGRGGGGDGGGGGGGGRRATARYTAGDYGTAVVVAAGCGLVLGGGNVAAAGGGGSVPVGVALLGVYLLADAATSTRQAVLFRRHRTSVGHQLFWINAAAAGGSAAALLATGAAAPAVAFVGAHDGVAADVAALSSVTVASQWAINVILQGWGALAYAALMTARQFASVVVSDVVYAHGLNGRQWGGVTIVVGGCAAQWARRAVAARRVLSVGAAPGGVAADAADAPGGARGGGSLSRTVCAAMAAVAAAAWRPAPAARRPTGGGWGTAKAGTRGEVAAPPPWGAALTAPPGSTVVRVERLLDEASACSSAASSTGADSDGGESEGGRP